MADNNSNSSVVAIFAIIIIALLVAYYFYTRQSNPANTTIKVEAPTVTTPADTSTGGGTSTTNQ